MRLLPEEEAVLLGTRDDRDGEQERRLRSLLAEQSFDWGRFWSKAAEQQVRPLLAHKLLEPGLASSVPDAALRDAKAVIVLTALSNLAGKKELSSIGDALRARDLPVIPLKGVQLGERLFGHVASRTVGDIDILVRESDLEAARQTLLGLGYRVRTGSEEHAFHGAPYTRHAAGGDFTVELHWGLSDPRFVAVDYGLLWERTLAATDKELPLRPMPGEETLLFLAIHLPKHDLGTLRLLVDIDRLVRREGQTLDWAFTIQLAERWQASPLLYFALHRAQQLLLTPVPAWVMERLRPQAWRRIFVDCLVGPRTTLRPPSRPHLRSRRFRLAYCAMLARLSWSTEAYLCYLFPAAPESQRGGLLSRAARILSRLVQGIGGTGLVLADVVAEPLRDRRWWWPVLVAGAMVLVASS